MTTLSVYSLNSGLVALLTRTQSDIEEDVPGGGRVLITEQAVVAAVAELLGPSARATNPFEQRRRKEFLRRVIRVTRVARLHEDPHRAGETETKIPT